MKLNHTARHTRCDRCAASRPSPYADAREMSGACWARGRSKFNTPCGIVSSIEFRLTSFTHAHARASTSTGAQRTDCVVTATGAHTGHRPATPHPTRAFRKQASQSKHTSPYLAGLLAVPKDRSQFIMQFIKSVHHPVEYKSVLIAYLRNSNCGHETRWRGGRDRRYLVHVTCRSGWQTLPLSSVPSRCPLRCPKAPANARRTPRRLLQSPPSLRRNTSCLLACRATVHVIKRSELAERQPR